MPSLQTDRRVLQTNSHLRGFGDGFIVLVLVSVCIMASTDVYKHACYAKLPKAEIVKSVRVIWDKGVQSGTQRTTVKETGSVYSIISYYWITNFS